MNKMHACTIHCLVILGLLNLTKEEILEKQENKIYVPLSVIQAANLTPYEYQLLPDIRWQPSLVDVDNEFKGNRRRGIPPDVRCQSTTWCDELTCIEVCQKGTVELDPWFQSAIKSQLAISRELPLCYAQWLGSHNSGITIANGYGNRDEHYTKLLKWTKWDKGYEFQTHDHWFTLTDQLNMGTRLLELDVHWVKDDLRIAHCGGLKNRFLDYLTSLVNLVAKLLGKELRWDTQTIGCYPSASSIKATDQRLFVDAMEEIANWLKCEDNADEFLIIFLDDQHNLEDWGLLPLLRKQLLMHIPHEWVFSPRHKTLLVNGTLPSAKYLLKHGKRLMFVSSKFFYDLQTRSLLFSTKDEILCDWWEPHMELLDLGECMLLNEDRTEWIPTMSGKITRLQTCEVQYGPLSCGLHFNYTDDIGACRPILNSTLLTKVFNCGFSFPSPDRLTPTRALSAIWSWAPGEPKLSTHNLMKTVISAEDGYWRVHTANDVANLPVACVSLDSMLHYKWELQRGKYGRLCHPGFIPAIPRHGKENSNLQKAMKYSRVKEARLIGVSNYLYDKTPPKFII